MKNAGKACNNRLYRHIRTFEKIVKNYFVIYCKSYIDIKEIVNNIAVSAKTKDEKIHLFQILRNDTFTKAILTEVSYRDFAGRLFNDERYSALITVGKLSYYLSRIKNKATNIIKNTSSPTIHNVLNY